MKDRRWLGQAHQTNYYCIPPSTTGDGNWWFTDASVGDKRIQSIFLRLPEYIMQKLLRLLAEHYDYELVKKKEKK